MWAYSQWWHCVNSNIERLMIWKLISSQFEFWMHRKLGHLEGERTGTLCVGGARTLWYLGHFFFFTCVALAVCCGTVWVWYWISFVAFITCDSDSYALHLLCFMTHAWHLLSSLALMRDTHFPLWHMHDTHFPLWHLYMTLTFRYETCMTSLSVMTYAWPHFPLW